MIAGPIFHREALTTPRRARHYLTRAAYVSILFMVMWTAWQLLIGWQQVTSVGEEARFGGILFQFFGLVQLCLMLFFAPLFAALAISQEKDRRTFVLLLMTDLRNVEIVLGKLAASLLQIGVFLAAAAPAFALCLLLGGVAAHQVIDLFLITGATILAAGSLGALIALWREKTFQTLALVVLAIVIALGLLEAAYHLAPNLPLPGMTGRPWIEAFSPFRALLAAFAPNPSAGAGTVLTALPFTAVMLLLSLVLNLVGIVRLRAWNPSGEPREPREEPHDDETAWEQARRVEMTAAAWSLSRARDGTASPQLPEDVPDPGSATSPGWGPPGPEERRRNGSLTPSAPVAQAVEVGAVAEQARAVGAWTENPILHHHGAPAEAPAGARSAPLPRRSRHAVNQPTRPVWDRNPILWREVRTRAYGHKPLLIKAAYVVVALLLLAYFVAAVRSGQPADRALLGWTLGPLAILSLLLINAQAVTSITGERDARTLDLLLATELSPRQFIFGKLAGVFYNIKEMVIVPLVLAIGFAVMGFMGLEVLSYVVIDLAILMLFAAATGIHAALTFDNTRTAVANSLGTIFFLFGGILICVRLILFSGGEFQHQIVSFSVFIFFGSIALYASLGAKNPSQAFGWVAGTCPFFTFYSITSLLRGDPLATFLVSAAVYGFAILAMLIPAVSEFDVALGRTTLD